MLQPAFKEKARVRVSEPDSPFYNNEGTITRIRRTSTGEIEDFASIKVKFDKQPWPFDTNDVTFSPHWLTLI